MSTTRRQTTANLITTSSAQVDGSMDYSGDSFQNLKVAAAGANLSVTVSVAAGERVFVSLDGDAHNPSGTDNWADFKILLDGSTVIAGNRRKFVGSFHDQDISLSGWTAPLSAGSHTFTVQIAVNGGLTIRTSMDSNRPFILSATRWAPAAIAVAGAFSTKTTAALQLYVDGSSGSDANDGLTVDTPKATLDAVFSLIPDVVRHNVCVNMVGTFSEFGTVYLSRSVQAGCVLLLDGGSAVTQLDAQTSADIHTASSIGKTGAGYTVDQYAGYIVELTSGTYSGERRTIQSNTSTTLVPSKNFSGDPGTANFRIVKPTTLLTSTTALSQLVLTNEDGGSIEVQRLAVGGTKCEIVAQRGNLVRLQQVFSTMVSATYRSFAIDSCSTAVFSSTRRNPSTFAEIAVATEHIGCTDLNTSLRTEILSCPNVKIEGGFFDAVLCVGSHLTWANAGARIRSLFLLQSTTAASALTSASGYALLRFGGHASLAALKLDVSSADCDANIDISASPDHGIKLQNSYLQIRAVIASATANTGYGVLLEQRSVISLIAGITPTLSGTTAETAIYNGSSAATSTWATIAGGTALNDTDVHSTIRKR